MIQQKFKQEVFAKPQEEMLTIQVKNTTLHLNGQNLRLAAKNGRNSKTPGLHLSATHGKEALGQLTVSSPTQEGTAQLDLLVLKSARPDSKRQAENQPMRRPLKLAPLQLPEEVMEAQRQKLQQEAKPASCKLDEPRTRTVKSCVRQTPVKAKVGPSVSTEPLKAQQQNRSSRPQLTRCIPIEQNGGKNLEDVVCRGTPAPMCSKPAPPLLSQRIKAQATRGGGTACQHPGTLQQETGRRRLRLSRAQCLQEDQCNSNPSTGGLPADEGKLAPGVQGKGQQAERVWRGQTHAGKVIKEIPGPGTPWEHGSARKSHQEGGSQQSAGCSLNHQSAEAGSSECLLDGVNQSASNWRLKRRKPLIAKHNNVVHLGRLQL
ncbi:uncharacterized protein LOC118469975 [Amphiprion ocellaris]|uniref:uncharacterized protein LOC118469975 n=1 Tax=Amphiprion ocellaris TaxID=80972 RepID=UPI002411356E|nr:uncharacterized protein LOC118469975 [Amphiprion ocellaris]